MRLSEFALTAVVAVSVWGCNGPKSKKSLKASNTTPGTTMIDTSSTIEQNTITPRSEDTPVNPKQEEPGNPNTVPGPNTEGTHSEGAHTEGANIEGTNTGTELIAEDIIPPKNEQQLESVPQDQQVKQFEEERKEISGPQKTEQQNAEQEMDEPSAKTEEEKTELEGNLSLKTGQEDAVPSESSDDSLDEEGVDSEGSEGEDGKEIVAEEKVVEPIVDETVVHHPVLGTNPPINAGELTNGGDERGEEVKVDEEAKVDDESTTVGEETKTEDQPMPVAVQLNDHRDTEGPDLALVTAGPTGELIANPTDDVLFQDVDGGNDDGSRSPPVMKTPPKPAENDSGLNIKGTTRGRVFEAGKRKLPKKARNKFLDVVNDVLEITTSGGVDDVFMNNEGLENGLVKKPSVLRYTPNEKRRGKLMSIVNSVKDFGPVPLVGGRKTDQAVEGDIFDDPINGDLNSVEDDRNQQTTSDEDETTVNSPTGSFGGRPLDDTFFDGQDNVISTTEHTERGLKVLVIGSRRFDGLEEPVSVNRATFTIGSGKFIRFDVCVSEDKKIIQLLFDGDDKTVESLLNQLALSDEFLNCVENWNEDNTVIEISRIANAEWSKNWGDRDIRGEDANTNIAPRVIWQSGHERNTLTVLVINSRSVCPENGVIMTVSLDAIIGSGSLEFDVCVVGEKEIGVLFDAENTMMAEFLNQFVHGQEFVNAVKERDIKEMEQITSAARIQWVKIDDEPKGLMEVEVTTAEFNCPEGSYTKLTISLPLEFDDNERGSDNGSTAVDNDNNDDNDHDDNDHDDNDDDNLKDDDKVDEKTLTVHVCYPLDVSAATDGDSRKIYLLYDDDNENEAELVMPFLEELRDDEQFITSIQEKPSEEGLTQIIRASWTDYLSRDESEQEDNDTWKPVKTPAKSKEGDSKLSY